MSYMCFGEEIVCDHRQAVAEPVALGLSITDLVLKCQLHYNFSNATNFHTESGATTKHTTTIRDFNII